MLTQFSIKYSEKSFDILGFLFLMDFIGKYYIRKKWTKKHTTLSMMMMI